MDLVIFDLDGTLVDTAPVFAAAAGQVFAGEREPDAAVDAACRLLAGAATYESVFRGQVESAARAPQQGSVDRAVDRLDGAFRELYPANGTLYPGVYRLLMALEDRVSCGIVGSAPAPLLEEMVDYFGLDGYIGRTCSMAADRPPAHEVVAGWMNASSSPDGESMWVSSRPVQLDLARQIGARTVFAAYGYGAPPEWTPDHRLERLSGLFRQFPRRS